MRTRTYMHEHTYISRHGGSRQAGMWVSAAAQNDLLRMPIVCKQHLESQASFVKFSMLLGKCMFLA